MHRKGFRSQALKPEAAHLARDLVNEVKPAVTSGRRFGGHQLERLGLGLARLLRGDHAVFLHAPEHVGEAFLGALRMALRVEKVRTFG